MNEHFSLSSQQRVLLIGLALAFAGMAAVSLWQRLTAPDLVVASNAPRGQAARDMGGGADAEIGKLMQRLQQNPNNVDIMLHLAEHLSNAQNWSAAENFLRRAVVTEPNNPHPLYLLVVALHNQGNNAEAAACRERVTGVRDEPAVRYSLGILYLHSLQEPARGMGHLRAALDLPGLSDELRKVITTELAAQPSPEATTKAVPVPTTGAKKTRPEKKALEASPRP